MSVYSNFLDDISSAARAFFKLTYHASTRAGEVTNHSFPGLSGTSALTGLRDECNALSRAAESSVRKNERDRWHAREGCSNTLTQDSLDRISAARATNLALPHIATFEFC